MSASRETTLWCDAAGCGQWTMGNSLDIRAVEVRRTARKIGWKVAVPSGDGRRPRDYCPLHAKEYQ